MAPAVFIIPLNHLLDAGNGQKKHRDLAFGLDKGNPHNANVVPNTTLKSPASILQALKVCVIGLEWQPNAHRPWIDSVPWPSMM